jgi:hypothetical protein
VTVLFGNTPDAYTVGASGAVQAGVVVQFYTDAARTVPATGLTDEDGSPSDSALPSQQGRVVGSTVTSKANGVLSFGAPDGTTKLYYNRGDGTSGVLVKQGGIGGGGSAGIGTDTDGVPYLTS